MATTTDKTTKNTSTQFENPFTEMFFKPFQEGPFSQVQQTYQDLYEVQMKGMKTLADHTLDYGKKINDQMTHNLTETSKMAQETMKYSFGLMDDFRQIFVEGIEKTMPKH